MIFRKNRAEERKEWLKMEPVKSTSADGYLTYEEFLNRDVLQFSLANLKRSIPSIVDGFKPSQRKILYACLKKGLHTSEMKVAQLAG